MTRSLLALALTMACGGSAAPVDSTFKQEPLTTVTSRDGKLRVAVFTSPEQPPSRGTVTARITITDARAAAVDGLVLDIAPEMPSMGHGTPVVPRVTAKGGGVYLAEDVDLFMAGRWDLRMNITGAANDVAIIPVDVR